MFLESGNYDYRRDPDPRAESMETKTPRKTQSSSSTSLSRSSSRNAATACADALTLTSACYRGSNLYVPSSPEEDFRNPSAHAAAHRRRMNLHHPSSKSFLPGAPAAHKVKKKSASPPSTNHDHAHCPIMAHESGTGSPVRDHRHDSPLLNLTCKRMTIHPELRRPLEFSLADLQSATKNFSHAMFLGEGESGYVYKGVLKDYSCTVAVKIVSQETEKFHTELEFLSCIDHANVIGLVGYCKDEGRSMLVYDFMSNGTLHWHLSARNPLVLPWRARRKIAVQIARGLHYLHENCPKRIVHRDIRPKNILLKHDFTPVIAGFGLATCVEPEQQGDKPPVVSQPGYAAPEYVEKGELSEKADVYSFGVLLLELISARRLMVESDKQFGGCLLMEKARPLLEDFQSVLQDILDPRLKMEYDHYELFCMVTAACMCTKKDPAARPGMQQVLCAMDDARDQSPCINLSGSFPRCVNTLSQLAVPKHSSFGSEHSKTMSPSHTPKKGPTHSSQTRDFHTYT